MRKLFVKLFLFIFLFNFGFLIAPDLSAQSGGATLFLSPASGAYTINKSFTVKVLVNSGGGAGINAAEGVINYDPSFLVVSKVSNTGSIFKLWTADPTFSNTDGKITFGGGSPSAYKGDAGEIMNITFTAQKAGTADVTWLSGIVLAADGKGTNVFSGFGNGKYTLNAKEEKKEEEKKEEEKKEEVKGILPPLPDISSKSHPKSDIWYSNNNPEFAWKLLTDLTGVSYSITDEVKSEPDRAPDGIVETQKFEDQADGEWYFHLKFQNRFGWGQTAHQKFLVDATPPDSFIVTLDNGNDPTNPTPKLRFMTKDEASGLSHYMMRQDIQETRINLGEVEQGHYQLQPLAPGEYLIDIMAFDKAENTASSSIRFVVEALKPPIISSIPKVIDRKDELIIRGTSFYPRVKVKVFISQMGKEMMEAIVDTDDSGNWTYFHKRDLKKGNYEIWAKIIDERGAQSHDSTRHYVTVVSPAIIETFGLLIIVILIIIIIALILFILYQNRKYNEERIRIMSETEEVKSKLGKIFTALREEVDELIELADKKPGLSESEKKVKEKLQESLDISEEFISKEVEDVEKEIKLKKK